MRRVVLGVLLVSTGAMASPGLVIDELPEPCRALAIETQATSRNRALSARISLAGCLIDQRMREQVLCDCEQSVLDVEAASAQSIALLEEVATTGDPTLQILARHALGELLIGLITRMLATVPPVSHTASPAALALRDTRVQMLAQRLQPWRDRARAAYRDVDQIARANPPLQRNPVVASAVRTGRERRAQLESDEVARR